MPRCIFPRCQVKLKRKESRLKPGFVKLVLSWNAELRVWHHSYAESP